MSRESELRDAICDAGRRLYDRNLIVATDGNISARLDEDRFLCTASGDAMGELRPSAIVTANAQGEKVAGEGQVNSEIFMHLTAYELRPEIEAVIHAHPPHAVALSLAGVSMETLALPELVVSVGGVPTADYATPGSPEGADAIRPLIGRCDALLLDRHGAVTVGESVVGAFWRMEKLEHAAESLVSAHLLGGVSTLDADQLARLMRSRANYGATGKVFGVDV